MKRLEAFEKWGAVQRLDLTELIDAAALQAHWANHDSIVKKMRESQKLAEQVKLALREALTRVATNKHS